jgi:hypothetical protein
VAFLLWTEDARVRVSELKRARHLKVVEAVATRVQNLTRLLNNFCKLLNNK